MVKPVSTAVTITQTAPNIALGHILHTLLSLSINTVMVVAVEVEEVVLQVHTAPARIAVETSTVQGMEMEMECHPLRCPPT